VQTDSQAAAAAGATPASARTSQSREVAALESNDNVDWRKQAEARFDKITTDLQMPIRLNFL